MGWTRSPLVTSGFAQSAWSPEAELFDIGSTEPRRGCCGEVFIRWHSRRQAAVVGPHSGSNFGDSAERLFRCTGEDVRHGQKRQRLFHIETEPLVSNLEWRCSRRGLPSRSEPLFHKSARGVVVSPLGPTTIVLQPEPAVAF